MEPSKKFKLKIYFSRINFASNKIDNISTSTVDLTDSILFFKNNIIKYDDVDIDNDIIEVSFILISEKIKRCKPLKLDLKSFEIDKNIKKLFEFPDKSFIDINYLIKSSINEEKNLIIEDNNEFKNEEKLLFSKHHSSKLDSKINNIDNEINYQKYYTPMLKPKISKVMPNMLDLNAKARFKEENMNLTEKIFEKIFNKNKKDNLNNSIEVIKYSELKDYKDFISSNSNKENKYGTFCLGLFISGLKSPLENSSFIENSRNFISSCCHKNCSNLLSLKPDLLSIYLNKNIEISNEINYLVANISFPLGIKICFENINEKINNKIQKIYYNIIKNAQGEIYYITTLQYFIKVQYKIFKEKYKFDLISYYINREKKENFIKKVTNESIIYVPENISLLGKYPFFIPMNICLNVLISLQTIEEKNILINHIINEVPIPNKLKQILFYIPLIKETIRLNHKYNIYKEISQMIYDNKEEDKNNTEIKENLSMSQFNSIILLEKISIKNIIFLFQLLLLEQQIIIVENNYEILSKIIFILIDLIYPLNWINPFSPILNLNTVQFLQSPTPFIMGLDEYLLSYALNLKNICLGKEIIIYNISSQTFILGKTKKKINKKDIINELKLNALPENVNKFLESELKKKKIFLEKNKNKNNINENEIDMDIRLIFIKAMLLLIGNYNSYTFYTKDDNMPLFNKEAFVDSHKDEKMKLFLGQMVKTQIFNQFLLNEKQLYLYNKNIKDKNIFDDNFDINNCVDTSYFKKIGEKFKSFIYNKKRKSSFDLDYNIDESNLDSNFDNNKNNLFKLKFNFESSKELNKKNLLFEKNDKLTIHCDNFNFEKDNNKLVNEYYSNIIIKKKNKIKKFLLFPYFIKQNKDKSNLNYDIIYEKILDFNIQLLSINEIKNKIYIIPINKINFDFSPINKLATRIYIISSKENELTNNDISNKNEIINIHNNNINININNKCDSSEEKSLNKDNTSENNKENYDLITDCFTLCLTNKAHLTESTISLLESLFSESCYRNYFSNLLIPDIKRKIQHKQLTSLSFLDLVYMIKLCFSKLNEDEYQNGIRLTLASFSFYKREEENKIFIYQSLGKDNICYKIFEIDSFWIEFFKLEMLEAKKQEEINFKNLDNDKSIIEFKSKSATLMDISIYIFKIMEKLNLNKEFIYKIFEKLILPTYEFDYENINKIMKKIKGLFGS